MSRTPRLALRRETLTALADDEMSAVAAGALPASRSEDSFCATVDPCVTDRYTPSCTSYTSLCTESWVCR